MLLPSHAYSESALVIYPNIREPYLSVFKEIISGVQKNVKKIKTYKLKKGEPDQKLVDWVKKKKIKTVIALGKQGVKKVNNLPEDIEVIIGAVLLPPSQDFKPVSGITLSPSPYKLFEKLASLSPQVKTITVIYSEKNNGWLIEYAQSAATEMGYELRALEASNVTQAATHYKKLMAESLDKTHAVWLLQDRSTVDSKTILPTLLDKAWAKKFIVFSSNPSYVKRGILFSLYPNNKAMGYSLGGLVKRNKDTEEVVSKKVKPLEDLKIAVNLRAAEHLGLNISKSDLRKFDLIFPPPR